MQDALDAYGTVLPAQSVSAEHEVTARSVRAEGGEEG